MLKHYEDAAVYIDGYSITFMDMMMGIRNEKLMTMEKYHHGKVIRRNGLNNLRKDGRMKHWIILMT